MTRRYAEDTSVSVTASQGDVQDLLEKNGVEKIGIVREKGSAKLWFEFKSRYYLLEVPIPKNAKNPEQEMKRAWRVLLLLIKAKFEAIRGGITSIEEEFFSKTIMPDGQTLIAHSREQMEKAYTNREPLQLGFGDKK